jgi:hypothetical protein
MKRFLNRNYRSSCARLAAGVGHLAVFIFLQTTTATAASEPRIETVRHNGVTLTMTLDPGSVYLDEDMVLSLRLTHPDNVSVKLPPLANRLKGFMLASSFDRPPSAASESGLLTREHVYRLTPLIADEYRIAPMAVAVHQGTSNTVDYFATPPLVIPVNAVTDKPVDDTLRSQIKPVPIRPSLKTLSGYVAIAVLIAIVMGIGIWLLGRIQHQVKIMRMSPKERALQELEQLLGRRWVEAGRVKDFYVELTMIVRRYIERQHHIRAPEQTTLEFLMAIAADPRFPEHVMTRLKQFLEAADLVKFAGWQPDSQTVDTAVNTARNYLSSDADDSNESSEQRGTIDV